MRNGVSDTKPPTLVERAKGVAVDLAVRHVVVPIGTLVYRYRHQLLPGPLAAGLERAVFFAWVSVNTARAQAQQEAVEKEQGR